ncbi:MAG: flagellar protein FlaG [Pseudomonadota bacterium]|nr:flagellar protein FlaG [Pseudomonadota bacterium]
MNELKSNAVDLTGALSSGNVSAIGRNESVGKAVSLGDESGNSLPVTASDVAELSSDQVKEAVSRINEYIQQTDRVLDFQLDEDSGKTVIRVYDKASEELIRQIPSELALELAQKLNDEEPSLLFSAQV